VAVFETEELQIKKIKKKANSSQTKQKTLFAMIHLNSAVKKVTGGMLKERRLDRRSTVDNTLLALNRLHQRCRTCGLQ